ncbi:hypothetical protein BKA61DRAFT_674556 [Leptodontidium sp. MPI-SDFR-AT-0119]|nr:hypothetical protein BKA61DRAFT_674556 [Leptodontidium sp. MPI-SDFR-AT-0119]
MSSDAAAELPMGNIPPSNESIEKKIKEKMKLNNVLNLDEEGKAVGGAVTRLQTDKYKLMDTKGLGINMCFFTVAVFASLYFPFTVPTRATFVAEALPFGFDLPLAFAEYLRTLISYNLYTLPTQNIANKTLDMETLYTKEQETYFWKLVDLALAMRGRDLTGKDFAAIADAMRRRFSGDVRISNRGYNNMDSRAKKKDGGFVWEEHLNKFGIMTRKQSRELKDWLEIKTE